MKRIKPLKIRFESEEQVFEKVEKALKSRKKHLQPEDTKTFSSVKDFQSFLTVHKIALLATIYNNKPESVYQLAKLVGRTFPSVKKDCDTLEAAGFITQDETGDARGTKTPSLSFNYNSIVVYLPNTTYSHNFETAA